MSAITTPTTSGGGGGNALIAGALDGADQRYHPAAGMRKKRVRAAAWSSRRSAGQARLVEQ